MYYLQNLENIKTAVHLFFVLFPILSVSPANELIDIISLNTNIFPHIYDLTKRDYCT